MFPCLPYIGKVSLVCPVHGCMAILVCTSTCIIDVLLKDGSMYYYNISNHMVHDVKPRKRCFYYPTLCVVYNYYYIGLLFSADFEQITPQSVQY